MTLLIVIGVVFTVFAFDSILVIYVHRRALGKFDVSADWERLFSFTTSTGLFTIRSDLRQVHCTVKGHKTVMRFEDLRSLELRIETETAVLGEFLLDPDMEEHWKDERDYIVWNTVSLTSNDGTLTPVFRSGKYIRRKYLHEFYTEAQLAILQSCKLLTNVDEQRQDVISRLKNRLDFLPISNCHVEN